jgi:2'-5' RNA ligase
MPDITGAKKRLFLAVNLTVGVTRKIADAVGKMRASAERTGLHVGWVPPANLHVTLKFLGWSSPDVVDAIRDRVLVIAAETRGFELAARGAGGFPEDAHARILWVGLQDPAGALGSLASRIDHAMTGLGYAAESRPYHPHITVGRVKDGHGTGEILAPWQKTDFGSSAIRDIVLYESFTKSTGSEYMAQFRVALSRPERQTRDVEGVKESEEPDGNGQHQP